MSNTAPVITFQGTVHFTDSARGRANHLKTWTACGRPAPVAVVTDDFPAVTCPRCIRQVRLATEATGLELPEAANSNPEG